MPRRREVPKRSILPDPKYGSKLVAKFINNVMRKGKLPSALNRIRSKFSRKLWIMLSLSWK